MTMEIVNVGTIDNDPNCDSLRASFIKLNNNLSILGNEVTVRAPKARTMLPRATLLITFIGLAPQYTQQILQ